MSKPIQMYTDATKSEKAYPRTLSTFVAHGDKTLNEVLSEHEQNTALHTQLIGPYAKRISVPLTADYGSGKVLRVNAQTGLVEAVEKSGWGISRLTAEGLAAMGVSGGDTAFISMLNAEGQSVMESGIVIFAIETETRNDEGVVIRRTLTSKYNAQNADVTIDGHLQTDYDLISDQNLLISHPLTTEAVEFLRFALAAKEATTTRNLLAMMAKLATKEGVFLQMISGLSEAIWDTNPESGKSQEWLVGRPVLGVPDLTIAPKKTTMDDRSGENKDIVVDKVAGGAIGGQQMLRYQKNENWRKSSVTTITSEGDFARVSFTSGTQAEIYQGVPSRYLKGHKYISCALVRPLDKQTQMQLVYSGIGGDKKVIGVTDWTLLTVFNNIANDYDGANFIVRGTGTFDIQSSFILDLTLLFPLDPDFVNSLGPDDASRVLTRLGIIAIDVA